MSGSSQAPIQIVRTNTALDPVGVCLALEGRLNSSDGREALAGALRQASEGVSSSGGGAKSAPSSAGSKPQQAAAAAAAAPAPKCLSSDAHQLSGDCLSAFAAAADQPADDSVSSPVAGGAGAQPPSLSKQDTLPASLPAGSSGSASSGSSAAGAQRPLVTAAIERTSTATLDANGGVDHGAGTHDPSCTCPPYAVKSTCGKRPNMEDTYALCPNICQLPMSPMSHEYADKLPHRIAEQFETHRQDFPREAAAAAAAVANTQQAAQPPQQQQHHHPQPQASPQQPCGEQHVAEQPQQQQQQQAAAETHAEPSAAAFAGAAALPVPMAGGPEAESSVSSLSSSTDGGVSIEKLHFFGVYDGHGGIEASQHCAQRLHYHLSKAVAEMASVWLMSNAGEEVAGPWNPEVRFSPLDTARVDESSPGECFLSATTSADEAAAGDVLAGGGGLSPSTCSSSGGLAACSNSTTSSSTSSTAPTATSPAGVSSSGAAAAAAGAPRPYGRSTSAGSANAGGNDSEVDSNEDSSGDSSDTSAASFSGMMEDVLKDAFIKTDEEFSDSGLQAGLVGSTAVVALVGTHRVWIANCGDSRAVLSRGGRAIQVTDDHKPEREDEAERVEKAGGQVLYWNGHRVMGVLAMSRAIGDHCLRPYVIPEPEISVFARHARDELLLLASDGLWDVLSNQEATDLALRSIKRAREKGASRKAAARVAATVLTKAAVDRGSRDNITVVIIDLSPPPAGGDKADKPSTAALTQPDAGAGACALQQQAEGQQQQPQPVDAAEGVCRPASGRSSSSSSRQGSMKPGPARSGSGGSSNPFAAAAVSPFSTAATGSSELPLPSCAAHLDAGAASATASDRSGRNSAGGSSRLRGSTAGASADSSCAAAQGGPSADSLEMGSGFSKPADTGSSLATELDSLDLSGAQAVRGHSRRCSRGSAAHMAEASGSVTTAGNSSIASSQLEEQPTIIEPPPEMPDLYRQPSSSPFSTCQGPAFSDGVS